ncbi:GPR1/FUN34/yaaH family-domain-containing protein, partial [Terfezia claveryi]
FGNPAPLGLCAFALTTFVLSLLNANTQGVSVPSIVVGSAYAYGGIVQLLAGMWEMAVGTKIPYLLFLLANLALLTPHRYLWCHCLALIETVYWIYASKSDVNTAVGYFLAGWFIFTTICL